MYTIQCACISSHMGSVYNAVSIYQFTHGHCIQCSVRVSVHTWAMYTIQCPCYISVHNSGNTMQDTFTSPIVSEMKCFNALLQYCNPLAPTLWEIPAHWQDHAFVNTGSHENMQHKFVLPNSPKVFNWNGNLAELVSLIFRPGTTRKMCHNFTEMDQNLPDFNITMRFAMLLNFFSGLGNCLCPMFLSEISTKELRGALGTTNQLSVTIGLFLASVFGLRHILGMF